MIASHFFLCFVLISVCGILFVITMSKMAVYKPLGNREKKPFVFNFLGVLFILFAFIALIVSIYLVSQMQIPSEPIEYQLNKHSILRSYPPVIGYPTPEQQTICSLLRNVFVLIGLGIYCLFYRESDTTTKKKIIKFLYGFILWFFYTSASNLHYFDVWELSITFIFLGMCFFAMKKTSDNTSIAEESNSEKEIEKSGEDIMMKKEIDYSRFMPHSPENNLDDVQPMIEKEFKKSDITQHINYCRYCGNKIDSAMGYFCKHCGKKLT